SAKTVQPGEAFNIDVNLEMQANSHAISFVKLIWTFDPSVLTATGISVSSPFGVLEQLPPTPGVGRVGFSAGAGLNAVQNSMIVATVSFQAVGSNNSSTPITWDTAEALSLSAWDGA